MSSLHSRGGLRRGSLVDLRLSGIAFRQALSCTNIVFSQVSANTKFPRVSMNPISASFFAHLVLELKESVSQKTTSVHIEQK